MVFVILDVANRYLDLIFNRSKIFIPILILSSLFVRLYYAPFELPIASDAFVYFSYAIDITTLGNFPHYLISNDGWAIFLSFFFRILPSHEFMDYMIVQRLLSITLSTITIIPVYFLCRKFFGVSYSLIGATLFAFEPRLIQNSLLGITEPLYILLGTTAITLLFYCEKKYNYLSFFVLGLFTIVRIDGIFLIFGMTGIFFLKNKLKKESIKEFFICISIFITTLGLMILTRINVGGTDYSINRIQYATGNLIQSSAGNDGSFIINGITNLVKFFGWDLIPSFILFVPIGFIILIKSRNINKITILIPIIVMLLPAFYAYATKAFDTRYLFFLYPFLSVISLYVIESSVRLLKKRNMIFVFLLVCVLFSSIEFIEYKKMDVEHEKEAVKLANEVVKRTKVFNEYYPESQYVVISALSDLDKFPTLTSSIFDRFNGVSNTKDNLQEYLEFGRINGLTHLVVDDREYPQYRMKFLKDVFNHEEKYPYLIKIFDSKDFGYKYRLKIFEIDYDKFDIYKKQLIK